MKPKTPQEKKALSLLKDRRNTYGENDKASRRIIPLRKAKVNRGYRKRVNDVLSQIGSTPDLEAAELIESEARSIRRDGWKKSSDAPLGEVLEHKLERRRIHSGHGKAARKKIREILADLTIETEQETDGRWIAEARELNGVIVYGDTKASAISKCRSLAGAVYREKLVEETILEVGDFHISIETY